ncbi:MAG: DNA-binding transcriptional ArsR family regulator [Candidatus Pseudothioglobus sp.]|jgi:ArsR family transcriptional regulator
MPFVNATIDRSSLLSFCKATADGLRLDILRALSAESFGVLELCRIFDTPQSGMSHHLKILATAGLVATRREGNSIFYRRAMIASDHSLSELTSTLYETIDGVDLTEIVASRTREVHAERAGRSQAFFSRNAERLRDNQNLIAEFSQYDASIAELLANEQIPTSGRALEVGPGDCELINHLAKQFDHVTAIDNSAAMLSRAQAVVDPALSHKVVFQNVDIDQTVEALSLDNLSVAKRSPDQRFDLMVLNMVLHHMASPAAVFVSASKLLTAGACLLIADLCPHDQDWARETCGDLWLGFEPTDLDAWAVDAGLTRGQGIYLGLKNGFQIQVRLFNQPQIPPR